MTAVDDLILTRLDAATVPQTATDLTLAAVLGPEDFGAALGGVAPRRPEPPPDRDGKPEPAGTYMSSIEVTVAEYL